MEAVANLEWVGIKERVCEAAKKIRADLFILTWGCLYVMFSIVAFMLLLKYPNFVSNEVTSIVYISFAGISSNFKYLHIFLLSFGGTHTLITAMNYI